METIRGIAVFPGVAIGSAMVLDAQGVRIRRRKIGASSLPTEVDRLDRCLGALVEEIGEHTRMVAERLGSEVALIFDAHRRIVADPHLRSSIVKLMEQNLCSPEYAVHKVLRSYSDAFRTMKSAHFAERASDFEDIEGRIIGRLMGKANSSLTDLNREVVVLAHDLTPSQTASFDPRFVRGMATETGGRTSHTAIIAGSLEIPAVVGMGRFLDAINEGDEVIVDGHRGVIIVNPDEPTIRKYRSNAIEYLHIEEQLETLRDQPAETLDHVRVRLMGNIEFPHEAEHCVQRGADGVGLYRTEFLYLDRDRPPTEEEHFEAYASVLATMGPEAPVTLRTMDLGADKLPSDLNSTPEPNPFLGLRSIRLSLRNLATFKTQLRAILRASLLGNVRIMFPMISTLLELRRCRMTLADVMEDLEEEGIAFRRDIAIGMMVEVPSAAFLADQFARQVDFFSIGTNDLIQYTLAVDRTNETVAPLYNSSDPAVLKLVRRVIRVAERHGIGVNVCGEMSGDPIYAQLLLGLGLRQLSVTPHNIPQIKKIIRGTTIAEARKLADRVLRMETAGEIKNYLRNRTRHIVPELIDDRG